MTDWEVLCPVFTGVVFLDFQLVICVTAISPLSRLAPVIPSTINPTTNTCVI